MANENDQTQAKNSLRFGGRTDIAKVTFQDGSTMCFPSIASVTSASSNPTTPSPFGSRSSSLQRRGRPKASSFSSTASSRDQLGSLTMISDDDDIYNHHTTIMNTQHESIAINTRHDTDPLDYVAPGEDWDNSANFHSSGPWNIGTSQNPSDHSQDQLVANAHGAGQDSPRRFDDMEAAIQDLMMSPGRSNYQKILPVESSFGECPGPSSAPPASGWMHRRRQDSLSMTATSGFSDADTSFDLENVPIPRPARKPGRVPGSKLSEEKRRKVAVMRIIGACRYCSKGRRGCDPGTPCKPCVQHFGPDVLDKPNHCRRDIVQSLTREILSEKAKWHPYARELTDFFGRDFYVITWTVDIPIQFAFGPSLSRAVQIVETSTASNLEHQHVNYPPPWKSSAPFPSHDLILPVTFTDTSDLHIAIDNHLTLLVDEHITKFNYFNSGFQILHSIMKLFMHYRQTHHDYADLLRQALKLLVLIHSSDITVPADDTSVQEILRRYAPGYSDSTQSVTPCILRAELGKIVPQLAHFLLEDVLKKLFRICLVKRSDQHPIVIGTFSVLMMAIESIMCKSARIGFHANTALGGPSRDPTQAQLNPFASNTHPIESVAALQETEKAAQCLQNLYQNCFEDCHALLLRIIEHHHYTGLQKSFGEVPAQFIASLNQAIRSAGDYLQRKGSEKVDGIHDIGSLFDRLLARLFLLQTGPY